MSDVTDALESLVSSEGWRVLCARARAEWTQRERDGRRTALNDTDDKRALDKLRQITAAQEAVEWVLALPKDEIARLKRQELEPQQQEMTRQPFPYPHVGMSRRGGL